jgi:WD40-like Beta Propeller Repeat
MSGLCGSKSRRFAFAAVTCVCVAIAVGFLLASRSHGVPANGRTSVAVVESAAERAALMNSAHALVIEPRQAWDDPEARFIGSVSLVSLDPAATGRFQTTLRCDRVHFAAGTGICLLRDTSMRGMSDSVKVTLFNAQFQPIHMLTVHGVPSRARVSPDGRHAAFTMFVSGHTYLDANMSTVTTLVETATATVLGNLEEFAIWRDGARYQSPDVNFWGVTFAADGDHFYATLRTQGVNYLVRGSMSMRTVTVMQPNAECPSLSPDGTRLVFKKVTPERTWRLTVLDLRTLQETPLAETQSIDDQAEWLDAGHVLYESVDPGPAARRLSVMMVAADGSGSPTVFAPNAISPAVVRTSGTPSHH